MLKSKWLILTGFYTNILTVNADSFVEICLVDAERSEKWAIVFKLETFLRVYNPHVDVPLL